MSDPSYIAALKKIARDRAGIVEALMQPDYLKIAEDRPAAIVMTAGLEDYLQDLILSAMVSLTQSERADLFTGDRMLGSFSAKIQMAYALGLIGKEARRDLTIIRHIRNAFAHSRKSIFFDTQEIADACGHLTLPDRYEHLSSWPGIEQSVLSARSRFIATIKLYQTGIMQKMHPEFSDLDENPAPPVPLD